MLYISSPRFDDKSYLLHDSITTLCDLFAKERKFRKWKKMVIIRRQFEMQIVFYCRGRLKFDENSLALPLKKKVSAARRV
jgi:hypothetical protein